jgi:hypothetical protein
MSDKTLGPETATVALASLAKLIGLLGAELVVGRHRDDIDVFEQCVRAKLFAHVEGVSREATAEGVALAHALVEPVLRDLRERVRALQEPQPIAFPERPPVGTRVN